VKRTSASLAKNRRGNFAAVFTVRVKAKKDQGYVFARNRNETTFKMSTNLDQLTADAMELSPEPKLQSRLTIHQTTQNYTKTS